MSSGTEARRKITVREVPRMREPSWEPRLRGASLAAELDIRHELTNQVASVLGRQYGKLRDPRLEGESFLLRWPACLVTAMAGVTATRYRGGTLLASAVGSGRLAARAGQRITVASPGV